MGEATFKIEVEVSSRLTERYWLLAGQRRFPVARWERRDWGDEVPSSFIEEHPRLRMNMRGALVPFENQWKLSTIWGDATYSSNHWHWHEGRDRPAPFIEEPTHVEVGVLVPEDGVLGDPLSMVDVPDYLRLAASVSTLPSHGWDGGTARLLEHRRVERGRRLLRVRAVGAAGSGDVVVTFTVPDVDVRIVPLDPYASTAELHLACCNEDRFFCGAPFHPEAEATEEHTEDEACARCVDIRYATLLPAARPDRPHALPVQPPGPLQAMTPHEMSDALDRIEVAINALTTDPRDWGRTELDGAVEVWARFNRLIDSLMILRRDHAVVLARRIPDQYTATTRQGAETIHRTVPKNEAWDGHRLLGELAVPLVSLPDGDIIDAIPVDVARAVIPACEQGRTSSKWKVTEVRKRIPDAEKRLRKVTYGDAVVAPGPVPYQARRSRAPVEQHAGE